MKKIGRILVVDDEKELAKAIQSQLEELSYEVFTSFSGKEALSLLEKEESIDLMLVDVKMPGIDGIETIKRGIKIQPDLQCILMTGHAALETSVEAMKLGAINFLCKPEQITIDILDASIKEGLKKLELIRAVRKEQERLKKANKELSKLKDQLEANLKETTEELEIAKLKELSVSVMELSVQYYELAMKKGKVELAEESGIWNVSAGDGGIIPKTMNRYLKLDTFPEKRPKYRDIIKTGHFVLSRPVKENYSSIKKRLTKRLKELEAKIF